MGRLIYVVKSPFSENQRKFYDIEGAVKFWAYLGGVWDFWAEWENPDEESEEYAEAMFC